jgi:hypothetical protein
VSPAVSMAKARYGVSIKPNIATACSSGKDLHALPAYRVTISAARRQLIQSPGNDNFWWLSEGTHHTDVEDGGVQTDVPILALMRALEIWNERAPNIAARPSVKL